MTAPQDSIRLDDIDLDAAMSRWPARWSGEHLRTLHTLFDTARMVAKEFRDEAARLWKSDTLTSKGFSDRLAEKAGKEIQRLRDASALTLARARRERDALAKSLEPKTPKGDVVARTLRLAEIRQFLFKLPDTERWAAAQAAISDGEADVLAAILSSPQFIKRQLMPPEFLKQAELSWRRGLNPIAARELDEIVGAIEFAEHAVRGAERLVLDTPGISLAGKTELQDQLSPMRLVAAA